MNKVYAVNEISSIVTPILETFGVERAWVFGSYARGEATESSDIDLVTTEGLNHKANRERTKEFCENISEDEKLIYENKKC